MKITTFSTPLHDAFGITAELSASIEAKVQEIAAIDFTAFIMDFDTLTAVLYTSHPSLLSQYLHLPADDDRRLATEQVLDWHSSHECLQTLAAQGFFTRQLRELLAIAKADDLHGAKLAPVFSIYLHDPDRYLLDAALVSDLRMFLLLKSYTDGFHLVDQSEDECIIMPAFLRR